MLAPVWQRDHVFVTTPSSFPNELGRSEALAQGFTLLLPQLMHTNDATLNRKQVALMGSSLRREGWAIGGWGTFGQGTDPRQDGVDAAHICDVLGLDGWLGNGEKWAEGDNAWKSAAFLEGWHAAGAPCPVGVSCNGSTTANFAPPLDWQAWLEQDGALIAPQIYGNLNPALQWGSTVAALTKHAGVPADRCAMTFGTYVDDRLKWPIPWDEYRTWLGVRGAYLGERTPRAGWALLG